MLTGHTPPALPAAAPTMPVPGHAPATNPDRILRRQVRLLYEHALLSQLVALINSVILAAVQWPVIPHATIVAWLLCMIIVSGLRLAKAQGFMRARPDGSELPRWRGLFLLGVAASGVLWGAAGVVLFPDQSLPHQMFVSFVVAGMIAGSAATLSPLMPAFLLFAIPAIVPLVLQFLLRGGGVYFPMSVMAVIYGLAIMTVARHVNATVLKSLRLSDQNGMLLQELSQEHTRTEALNRHLQQEVEDRTLKEQALRDSQTSLAEAQRMANLGSWSYDPRTRQAHWSEQTFRIYGLDPSSTVPSCRALLSRLHHEDRRRMHGLIEHALTLGRPYETEFRLVIPGRGTRWIHALGQPALGPDGKVTFMRGTVLDITERKRQALQLEAERRVLQGIASGADLTQALESICRIVQEQCDAAGCVITVLAGDGRHLRFGAACGLPDRFARSVDGREVGPRAGSCGTAAYFNEQIVVPDIASDPLCDGFRDAALGLGLRACWSTPVPGSRQAVDGVVTVYFRQPRGPESHQLNVVARATNMARIAIERNAAEHQIRRLAHFDELTGLLNRAAFAQELDHALRRAERTGRRASLLFVDVDRFKNINETLGHAAGDHLLKEVAARLQRSLRKGDLIARFGGDEFIALLEDVPHPDYPGRVAGGVLDALAAPLRLAEQDIPVTASIGIATYPEDGRDPQTLQKHADIAMYRAKDQGRNSYCFYAPQSNVHSLERLTLEAQLRKALERGEFLLHYQPKQDIRTGCVTGMEALVRWQHPDLGLVSPARFVPLAEETGLIVPIGEWVLRTAAAQCAALRRKPGCESLRMAVNLSARQFADDSVVHLVSEVLAATGLEADGLELEITESLFMHNAEQASRLLLQLKALGVQLAMDDFGTGYSSLAYLKRFPIDRIKIDRSFIQGLPDDSDDATIAEAIIAMAHSLRLSIVAEGVETEQQMQFLRSRQCEELQGYYFSKPLPAGELEALVIASALKHATGTNRLVATVPIPVWP